MRHAITFRANDWMRVLAVLAVSVVVAPASRGDDSGHILTVDHYVRVKSSAPGMAGQTAALYVRERVTAGLAARGSVAPDKVVLFVHGAGTPAEVAFDVPYEDYSWMAHLARAGFDVFAMDVTGYGRSTRPPAMNDPCNLAKNVQAQFVPMVIPAPCAPTFAQPATTIASDWDDINAVVDYVRSLRHVDKVSLLGWSQGGPRAGGYAAQHQEKIQKLVLLAPAYNRATPATAPPPREAPPFSTQSHQEFIANWNRQVGCPEQYDAGAAEAVWSKMLESDPVGATWGPGVRRAPSTPTWGWTPAAVAKTTIPVMVVAGIHDKQVAPERVRELYTDLGSTKKIFIDLACSSHNAIWERNHMLLFRASTDWLIQGSTNGVEQGTLRLGYDDK